VLPYAVLGFLLWLAMLYSGIHATLAGVILAMMIPINHNSEGKDSLLHTVERGLSKWVAYLVLPIFGFANAGVSISSTGHMSLISPLGMGIIAGLFLGKQFGVLAAVYLAKQAGIGVLPKGATWRQIYGVAVLCGIGFTMSLFIGLLAFDDPAKEVVLKLSVLAGSLLSALVGALILLTAGPAETKRPG
jgi:NhaA family Na+:H+ antiporter